MRDLTGLPERVTVYEVGPRDGLQNEHFAVPAADKVRFVDLLSGAGLPYIEVTSFVRPGAIPQLADAEEVLAHIRRAPGVRYTALVPNLKGLHRAAESGLVGIAVFTAASETFSQKNVNASIRETLERFRPVISEARGAHLWIRGYVSTAFGCPYEGKVEMDSVLRVTVDLIQLGVDEVSISDTIGVATPGQVVEMVNAVSRELSLEKVALHFHDTRGTALANVLAGLQVGISTFDSAAGGLGGCPYAPGASGNLATEDLIYMLDGLGIHSGVSLEKVVQASAFLAGVTGRSPASRCYHAAVA